MNQTTGGQKPGTGNCRGHAIRGIIIGFYSPRHNHWPDAAAPFETFP